MRNRGAMCAIMARDSNDKTNQMQSTGKERRGSPTDKSAEAGPEGGPAGKIPADPGHVPDPAAGQLPAEITADVLKQFRVIFRSVKKHFQVIERKCGIGGSQLWALAAIVAKPGVRVSELAQSLSVHQSTASNLVEHMVRLGLIQRERDEEDQRVVRLTATARGNALLARAPQPLTGVLPDALSHMDAQALASLHDGLEQLLTVMKVRDESASHTPLADI
jgi:DNA-binding MarR family transcriptional regulator